jgi:HAD superfamily hydrolase (TIGR01450 family)
VRLDDIRALVLDIDGTLVQRAGAATHVQHGAREVLERIRATGRCLVFFTNGSHAPPAAFAEELREAGLDVGDDELLTPLRSVQAYLRTNAVQGPVLLFGTPSAREYLVHAGVPIVTDDLDGCDTVFVAHPDAFEFPAVERAARVLVAGAQLLTGSYAPAYAGADGPIFSRGAMLTAALAKASGAEPIVVGKPSPAALHTVVEHLGLPPEDIAVVGDDVTMDVALGRLGGCKTILVRSGISGQVDVDYLDESQRPDAVVDGVAELLEWL